MPLPVLGNHSRLRSFFARQGLLAAENGIKINFDSCPGGGCKKKQPASKKKPVDDELYSDDSDLESCDEDDE